MKSFQVAEFNAPLKEVDHPTPQPTGTQVLIKVKAAGVCHSDLHIWEGGYDLGHGRKPLSLRDRGVSLPRTMGHETVGEIVDYESMFLLCYVRGPEGLIVELAERLDPAPG